MEFNQKNYTFVSPIVEIQVAGEWHYYSQQSMRPGETVMSDEEYLAACLRQHSAIDNAPLRIQPKEEN